MGPLIVLYGTDTSGKSSTARALKKEFEKKGKHAKVIYLGWRGSTIPAIGTVMQAEQKVKQSIKVSKNVLKIRSLIITLVFFIDRYLRFLVKILPFRLFGYTVITDRYFYDRIFLDESFNDSVKRMLLKLVPTPSASYYLYASNKTLTKRDPTMPKESFTIQKKLFRSSVKMTKSIAIDTNKLTPKHVAALIIKNLETT